jgi:DNA-directed RNA polymerase specialized sigma24 family protein
MLNGARPDPTKVAPTLDDAATLELYEWLSHRRFALFGDLQPGDRDDALHETLVQTLEFADKLRDPGALHGASYTIGLRVRSRRIREYVRERQRASCSMDVALSWHPEHHLIQRDRRESVLVAIRALRTPDREIIQRFYFDEQTKEQIRGEMQLTDTQFRLRKTRALSQTAQRARAMVAGRTSRFDSSGVSEVTGK